MGADNRGFVTELDQGYGFVLWNEIATFANDKFGRT